MFSLKKFIYNGLLSAIGRLEDYQVMLNAAGWHDKGVLSQEDLAAIEAALAAHNEKMTEAAEEV